MTKSKTLLLGLCLLLAVASMADAAGKVFDMSQKNGIRIGQPGLQLRTVEAAPSDSRLAAGRLYYDTTDGLQVYTGAGFETVTTGTAGTADSVYNAGAWSVAADGTPIIYTSTATGAYWTWIDNVTGTSPDGVVIEASHASAALSNALRIYSSSTGTITDAIDASDAEIVNALVTGLNDLSGTYWDISGSDGAATFVGVTTGAGDVNVGTSKLIIAGATGKITGTAAADIDLNSVFTVDATNGNTLMGDLDVTGTWSVDAIAASTTTNDLLLDGDTTGGVLIGSLSDGDVTISKDAVFTLDIDIDGGDITCPADLTITPTGGDVDFNACDIWVDSGKHVSFNGSTDTNYIQLSTSMQVIATGDILLDPAGADVDIDGADLWIDGGNFLSLNGSTSTNTLAFSTNLNIVGSADILLDPAGGDIDCDAADLQLDASKKLSLNGATETDAVYSSTDLQIVAAADIILTPTGGQVGIIAADLAVATGKKIALNSIAGVANDFLYLSTNVILDAAADIVLDPAGGQVDVDAADLAVDSGKKVGFNGVAGLAGDFINYDGTDIIIDATADIKLNGAVSVDVVAALTVGTTLTVTGNVDANGDIVGAGPTTYIEGMVAQVQNHTTADTLTIEESGKVFTNAGDGDTLVLTLPEASTAIGVSYKFVVMAAFAMRIDPAASDAIIPTCIADKYIGSSTVGDTLSIVCIDGTNWVITSETPANGDWASE